MTQNPSSSATYPTPRDEIWDLHPIEVAGLTERTAERIDALYVAQLIAACVRLESRDADAPPGSRMFLATA